MCALIKYHSNLYAIDNELNPIVMSIKSHDNSLHVIVRTKNGSKSMQIMDNDSPSTDNVALARQVYPNLQLEQFENCTSHKAQQHVRAFDEKLEIDKFKFGVIYQRRGQVR
jgi:hypothetical protein